VLVFLAIATLHFGPWSPYRFVYAYFPGAEGIRAVSRIGLIFLIAFSVALAFGLQFVQRRLHLLAAITLGVLCMLEQGVTTEAFDKQRSWNDAERVAKRIGPECKAFLYESLQGPHPYFKYHLDAMWAELMSEIPTLNGYTGNYPAGWDLNHTVIVRPDEVMRLLQALDAWVARFPGKLQREDVCWIRLEPTELPRASSMDVPNVPKQVALGATVPVDVIAMNTGTETWKSGEVSLRGSANQGEIRFDDPVLRGDVAPGERVRFKAQYVPASVGSGAFLFELSDRSGRIGRVSPLAVLNVSPP
jgi:hypothetical protein